MIMFVIYLLIVAVLVLVISKKEKLFSSRVSRVRTGRSQSRGLDLEILLRQIWKQVYETASMDEARLIQTRLKEEGIECILYEQGKKDIHGNLLKGVGVAVPNAVASQAQASISKMPV